MASKYIDKLKNKSVLVIGGSSGIGYAVAQACVEFGARVVVASRSQERVNVAIERLRKIYPDAGDRIRGHVVNLSGDDSEASITKLFEFVTNGGRDKVNHVVETAGENLNISLTLQEATPKAIAEASSSRLFGVIILAKVATKYLAKEHTSSLTLTGGATAHKPPQGMSVLAAIGGAKDALARGLAVDMNPVRVNLVSPGAVQTELLDSLLRNIKLGEASADAEVMRTFLSNKSLLCRIGDAEDLAEAYLSIMKNYFVTGTIMHVNGGLMLK
ncbi:short chain dehydrogenase/reductase family [Colletotrichum tofieldiae]|uniref:Short chain dehydrogenase/reductase family n=2 Tax=Colletotrichum spaethianum species complex TaxID=2707349 RepID=A0A166VIT4_9PEZI|nr:short chain dehydrogenase/reductase family [Colletotrichum tofieldiae]GJC90819.1 short-chain dehydrogenase/reductase ATR9 [Colletotrichum liriopes]GKT84073.1 short chain dehydrogenase/reductase family [Colletotrichum tofieldiae]